MAGQQNISLKNITPYKGNAKKHNKQQIDNVAESIRQFGFVQPIVVDKDNVIVIGHCRYEAARKLKMQELPCVSVDTLTPEQVQKLRLLDNKLNESEWNFDLLAEQIPELDFSGFDVDWELSAEEAPAEVNTVDLKPFMKAHYLITVDINEHDKIAEAIKQISDMEGVEVDSSLN